MSPIGLTSSRWALKKVKTSWTRPCTRLLVDSFTAEGSHKRRRVSSIMHKKLEGSTTSNRTKLQPCNRLWISLLSILRSLSSPVSSSRSTVSPTAVEGG